MTINDIEVAPQNIVAFTLREWIFTQSLEMECTFLDTGIFNEYFPLYEDSKVYVEISTNTKDKPLILKMTICDFEIDKANSGTLITAIKFSALPDIDNYFMTFRTKVYKHKSTSDTFKEVFGNLNTPIDIRTESNDVQNWYQMAIDDYTFIRQTLKRSFVDEEDMPFLYMDRTQKMIYTSLRDECEKKSSANLIENGFLSGPSTGSPNDPLDKLKTTKKGKVIYFAPNIYRKNISSSLNKAGAYGAFFSHYTNRGWKDHVVNFKYHPMTTYGNTNIKHIGKFARADNFGTQTDSMHNNYFLAMVQNEYIRDMFFSDYVQISIPADNDIKLFDRVTLTIPDSLSLKSSEPLVDKVNSGDYVVGGIAHGIVRDGMYFMTLVLFRNGINAPEKTNFDIKMVK